VTIVIGLPALSFARTRGAAAAGGYRLGGLS